MAKKLYPGFIFVDLWLLRSTAQDSCQLLRSDVLSGGNDLPFYRGQRRQLRRVVTSCSGAGKVKGTVESPFATFIRGPYVNIHDFLDSVIAIKKYYFWIVGGKIGSDFVFFGFILLVSVL